MASAPPAHGTKAKAPGVPCSCPGDGGGPVALGVRDEHVVVVAMTMTAPE